MAAQEQIDAVTGETVKVKEPGQGKPDGDLENPVEAVEPVVASQGEQMPVQVGGGFNPDLPVAISAPESSAQGGVPQTPENVADGVEADPDFAGPVGDSGQGGGPHPEGSQTDDPDAIAKKQEESAAKAKAQAEKTQGAADAEKKK